MELVQGVTAAKAPPPRPDTYNTSKTPLLLESMRWNASLAFAWVRTTETFYPMASNLFKTNSEHILRAE